MKKVAQTTQSANQFRRRFTARMIGGVGEGMLLRKLS